MNRPDFLVIGGMKCGSTTLYRDLAGHPETSLPEKEMNVLSDHTGDDLAIRHAYERFFRTAQPNQRRGDVSTTYSMLPDQTGVPATAFRTLGPDLRIIYVVREPVSRAISHHYHMYSRCGADHMQGSMDRCVREHPSLVNYSRYGLQLAAWREYFPDHQIKLVVFEEYIHHRAATLNQLARFLEISEKKGHTNLQEIHNRSEGKPVLSAFWSGLRDSPLYLSVVRPIIPAALRERLLPRLLPQAPPRPAAPHRETIEYLLDRTREDVHLVEKSLGHPLPHWNSEAVRERLGARRIGAVA